MGEITSLEQLESLYRRPHPLVKNKVIQRIDKHTLTFIENSSFALFTTIDANGFPDVSPKGGIPGFIKAIDSETILFPDSSGNNRIDGLKNILDNSFVGLVFMVNGIDEVVRVKGTASIHTDEELIALCPDGNKPAKVVIKIKVKSLYFHCAKAVMLGKLWDIESLRYRGILPPIMEIIKDQQGR